MKSNSVQTLESRNLTTLDNVGIFCSGACAVHCLSIPVLTFFTPALTSYFENQWIHITLLFFVIPIAGFSFIRQKKIHGNSKPMMFGLLGVAFLVMQVVLEQIFHTHNRGLDMTLSIIGSSFLITGHIRNMKSLKLFRENNLKY